MRNIALSATYSIAGGLMSESAALTRFLTASAAIQQRDWDAAAACFAPDCEWTLVPSGLRLSGVDAIRAFMQGGMAAGDRAPPEIKTAFSTDTAGVFEYVSRGVATARAADFAESASLRSASVSPAVDLSPGAGYEFHVCFLFRLDAAGLISEVREYFAAPPPAA
jgi:ketosteroid isomerase-like protein